jgi:hypothetical protein
MNLNTVLIFILIAILSIGGYFVFEQNNTLDNSSVLPLTKSFTIPKIIIPKKSIEFIFIKNREGEYTFSGIFVKKDSPKNLVKNLNFENLTHDISINSSLEYNQDIILLAKKLFKELVNNYIEGSIIYKNNKLLIKGSVKTKKTIESIDAILLYSIINSFNATDIYLDSHNTSSNLKDETADIISNLVRTVDNGEDTIAELVKPKVIIKEKIVIKYKEPKIKEKIVIKYKNPIIKEKIVVKYIKVPVENKMNDKTSKITREEYLEELNSKGPDINIMSLPSVKMVDINIEDKIEKGLLKPLLTSKPLVKQETIYIIPAKRKEIDKKIPWANLHEMDAPLDGIVYDDVVASPAY